jgi:hypothetical protein
VRHDLVAVKIEVHPIGTAAPFWATEYAAVKGAGGFKIGNREGQVKGLHSESPNRA